MEEALEKGLAAFWREHRGGVRKNVVLSIMLYPIAIIQISILNGESQCAK